MTETRKLREQSPLLRAADVLKDQIDGLSGSLLDRYGLDESKAAEIVRTVLQSIREPSEGMIARGRLVDPLACDVEDSDVHIYPAIWEGMIDAALEEG